MSRAFPLFLTSLSLLFLTQASSAEQYFTGGDIPLSEGLQRELDARADQIRLGFNTRFQLNAGISPEKMGKIVIELCDVLPKNSLPGMVIYVDSFDQQNIPIAIGNRMLKPNIAPMEWPTYFDLGSLSAPVLTMPFITAALEQDQTLLDRVVQSSQLPPSLDSVTFGQLLRHELSWVNRDQVIRSSGAYFKQARLPNFQPSEADTVSPWSAVQDFELLAQSLAADFQAPLKTVFFEQVVLPIGMMNTISDKVPDTWRQDVAPGGLTPFHDRYAWGEAYSPSAFLEKENSVGGGLFSTADDLGVYARFWMKSYHMGASDAFSTETIQLTLKPQGIQGGSVYGLGWQLGEFGEKSFGWTGPDGRAFWIDPEANVFCVILTNPEHLGNEDVDFTEFTRSLVARLHQALLCYKSVAAVSEKKKFIDQASFLDPSLQLVYKNGV